MARQNQVCQSNDSVGLALLNSFSMSLQMQDGFDYEFVCPLDAKYECAICLLALRNPMQTTCGHRFCNYCIINCLQGCKQECPIDKRPLKENDLFHDSCIEREILQLKVKCPNNTLGCNAHIDLKYIDDHIHACNYQPVMCPNECSITILQKELDDHLLHHCLCRLVKCKYCQRPYIYNQEQLHLVDCPQVNVSCELCGTNMPRDQVANHKKEVCLNAEISCIFVEHGCHYKATRNNMKLHMDHSLNYHVQLLFTAYKKINTFVMDLYRNIGQIASGNFSRQPSFKSQLSTSSLCDNQMSPSQGDRTLENSLIAMGGSNSVEGSSFLCNENLDEKCGTNINEESTQLQKSLIGFDFSKHDNNDDPKSNKLVDSSFSHSSPQVKLLRDLSSKSLDVDQRVVEYSIKMENITRRLDVIEHDIKIMSKEFQNKFCNGSFVWKIHDFLRLYCSPEKYGKILQSNPFYTSPYGYKFYLRSSILSSGNEPYLTLYIHMMQSENDDFLDWPFLGTVSLQVLDCGDHSKKHFTETFGITTEMEAFKRPKIPKSVKGYGFKDFISLDNLINPCPGCLYLKDGALYIKAVITVGK